MSKTPQEAFGIIEIARTDNHVVYSDGMGYWAVAVIDFDRETTETDYTAWCEATYAVMDPAECAQIAREVGLDGIHCAGSAQWVAANA